MRELQVIDSFLNIHESTILFTDKEISTVNAVLSNLAPIFELYTDGDIEFDAILKDIPFQFKENEYIIKSFSLKFASTNVTTTTAQFSNIYRIESFQSAKFNSGQKSKYKCIILVELKKLKDFFYYFETVTYQDDDSNHFYDCLRIVVNDMTFDIVQIKKKSIAFCIIQSVDAIDYEVFDDCVFAIQQALGFCTSFMPGGEKYYFDENCEFYYCNFHRPEIDSLYKPVNINPHAFLSDKEEIANKYKNKLHKIPAIVFSNLANKIFESPEFSSIIILLLESSSIRSLLIIPSVFAVVIEALSKQIVTNTPELIYPISDTTKAAKVIAELHTIIEHNEPPQNNANTYDSVKLKRRINELNRPMNTARLTNNERLTIPFEQLGITLSLGDIDTIEHRNDLLHGDISMVSGENKTESEINNYMCFVGAKLYTLISALILKYVGYSGFIINHSKYYENGDSIKTDEEYYRII